MLDYDGTLVPFSRYPEGAVPDESVVARLRRLGPDIRNTVVIISGRRTGFPGQVVWGSAVGPGCRARSLHPHGAR